MSKSAISQEVIDYFPLEVVNKWIYRGYDNFWGYADDYSTRFEVTGKEIINDTLYYVATCNLFYFTYNMKYFRKDSAGNVYTRCNNQDRLLFKMDADNFEPFSSACGGSLSLWMDWPYMVSPSNFPYGRISRYVVFADMIMKKNFYVFSKDYGCSVGKLSSVDGLYFLKRSIHNGKIVTPQVVKLISIEYNHEFKKLLLKSLSILDTTTQIILESKKQGKRNGSLLRFKPDGSWDAGYGPNYSIESDLDFSLGDDTVKIIVPATVSDILGDKVDGNENQVWEGSPTDDYVATIIIPKLTSVSALNEPEQYNLYQNYPNPFNPSTKIAYSLDKSGFVTIKIYDVLGREITTIVNEHKKPGSYEANFNASTSNKTLTSGVYFYKLQVNNFTECKKMVFAKYF